MAKNQEYAAQLGSAWALHRQGKNDQAISEFNDLLRLSANNMDALYGLGLAQRSSGQTGAAQETFSTCIAQIAEAIQAHPREDRYQMLERLAHQRLDELKAKS